jgi:hypothetical protein
MVDIESYTFRQQAALPQLTTIHSVNFCLRVHYLRYFCLLESACSYLTVLLFALVIEGQVFDNTRDSPSLCLPLTLKLRQPRCSYATATCHVWPTS